MTFWNTFPQGVPSHNENDAMTVNTDSWNLLTLYQPVSVPKIQWKFTESQRLPLIQICVCPTVYHLDIIYKLNLDEKIAVNLSRRNFRPVLDLSSTEPNKARKRGLRPFLRHTSKSGGMHLIILYAVVTWKQLPSLWEEKRPKGPCLLRVTSPNVTHFFQGKPGKWKSALTWAQTLAKTEVVLTSFPASTDQFPCVEWNTCSRVRQRYLIFVPFLGINVKTAYDISFGWFWDQTNDIIKWKLPHSTCQISYLSAANSKTMD